MGTYIIIWPVRKLILKNHLSPGDIVMLTAAVRDLHGCYPGRFLTDVRTSGADLWENNPHITPLSEQDPEVEVVECAYPLIDRANDAPYHCLHGFVDFLNARLGLAIRPSLFKGDIHLSEQERLWYSQVHELTGEDTPFWIVAAGGKYDVTIKWWSTERYQKVIDHFRGRILFVQVGDFGHHHPPLKGVIDLRGQTTLRQLVRLVYHADGVLCPITAVMHLAAAVERKRGLPGNRPCVVVAGGREPVHWEAYPEHQFIHTTGALPCCVGGGCWRARTVPLGDGDERDQADSLCEKVVKGLPACMDMITPAEVIRRIELYYMGGVLTYLSADSRRGARLGVRKSAANDYDDAPLTCSNARIALERFVRRIPPYPNDFSGRGIVICGGGVKYFTNAWVCLNMLRRTGCNLPVELWHLGSEEMDPQMVALVKPLGAECVDALSLTKRYPVRHLGGWEVKPYAILYSRFREVLFLDADNVPVRNPEFLLDTAEYRETGALFWPDYGQFSKTQAVWDNCGLPRPDGPEFESGQIAVDKKRCWRALRLALWFNEHSDFYYRYLHGDKETFHLAFHKLGHPYSLVPHPIHSLDGTMCQHDFAGGRLFQHRNTDKWDLRGRNRRIPDFWCEGECMGFLTDLQNRWDGRMSRFAPALNGKPKLVSSVKRGVPTIAACMITCPDREVVCRHTLQNLATSDWGQAKVLVQMDNGQLHRAEDRQAHTALLALQRGLELCADYVLFLEDDLDFNRYLLQNLLAWEPVRRRAVTLAGLYNPGLPALACSRKHCLSVVAPTAVFGSQAFLLSRRATRFLVEHWGEVEGMQDIKMSRLAGRLGKPLFYHHPSLVQHVGATSMWGGPFHQADDFDPDWRSQTAEESMCRQPEHRPLSGDDRGEIVVADCSPPG